MKPTVARIVHYKQEDEMHAAVITKVWSETTVDLAVFESRPKEFPTTVFAMKGISSATLGTSNGTWSWPVIEK
jgi:hypothetical protein